MYKYNEYIYIIWKVQNNFFLFQNSEISLEYPEPKTSGNYVISSLDLHDGTFLFSYVSAFLSYVTPQELPVGESKPLPCYKMSSLNQNIYI